ncbi:MAG TPA: esterase-like activity of phytase family protein [Allosphingosinicella sp.]|nr:esterase-like activity of phytase family protein [Allosphingosinicella sp.]
MAFFVRRLAWSDPELGTIDTPKLPMRIVAGFGSGLTRRRGDPAGIVWAIGDRGPNLKIKVAVKRFGLDHLKRSEAGSGAKVMPRPDLGPSIAELRVHGDRVELVREIRIRDMAGRPISGLPVPEGLHAECEPALDLRGARLEPDPGGADTEGIAALAGGGFWVGDEYGPSLLRVDGGGRVEERWVPAGHERLFGDAGHPVYGALPAIAAKRQLNRGFEAIALSPDENWLHLAFQSPLAHPDEAAHAQARHVRLWRLEAASGEVQAQFLYPLDPPDSFRRDRAKGKLDWSDLKISELAADGADDLLVLERASETTKIYRVTLDPAATLPTQHLDIATRPSVEELSVGGDLGLPVLGKSLIFSSDDAPEVAADLEGMVILSARDLLLINDNDFGVEGAETSFWLVTFDEPVFRPPT